MQHHNTSSSLQPSSLLLLLMQVVMLLDAQCKFGPRHREQSQLLQRALVTTPYPQRPTLT
ncbi:hypothetical protein E2C01_092759 [Portunus trituberculatus]|uniref:Uncharacterized protein n=1 Tax=Portunus trituberculatus TaxID=210409 RepID=A0A5B7JSR3_PORTR|nr:hypothetical protein [Portunus trituberculatus]